MQEVEITTAQSPQLARPQPTRGVEEDREPPMLAEPGRERPQLLAFEVEVRAPDPGRFLLRISTAEHGVRSTPRVLADLLAAELIPRV